MTSPLFSPPRGIVLISTSKCTAACPNCCYRCNPSRNDKLTFGEAKDIIDQSIESYPDSIKLLVITGGECFTLGYDLYRIIEYASKEKGLPVRIVSNGSWANGFKHTYLTLKELQDLGLTEINISTGDEHQKFINIDNVINVIVSALLLKMTVAINAESSPLDKFNCDSLYEDSRLIKYDLRNEPKFFLIKGKWMYFRKQTKENLARLIDFNNKKEQIIPSKRCTSIMEDIVVTPKKGMLSCCGLTAIYSKYLYLGNLHDYSVKQIYENQFNDFIKIWLFTDGPEAILNYVRKKRGLPILDCNGIHTCQICGELFRDDSNIAIIKDNCRDIMQSVIIRYNLLLRRNKEL
jgi:organic radical activating enzyme